MESLVRAGIPLINTVGAPGTQGATMAGTQGTGTPRAAMTSGFAGELHNPKVAMFSSGTKSMMVAAGRGGGDDGPLRYDDQRHRGLPHRAHDHGPFDDELTHRCHLPGDAASCRTTQSTPSPARPPRIGRGCARPGPQACLFGQPPLHERTEPGCLLSPR